MTEKLSCVSLCFIHLTYCSCISSHSKVCQPMNYFPSFSPKLEVLSISKKHLVFAAIIVFHGMHHQLLTVCSVSLVTCGKCVVGLT